MSQQTPQKRELLKHTLGQSLSGVLLVVSVLFILATIAAAVVSTVTPVAATAATNATLNFQARLETNAGAIVPDGTYNVEFKLYNALTSSGSSQGSCTGDAACLWTETRIGANKVTVTNGYLTVNLASVTAFSGSINWDQNLYLTMNIGGTGTPSWDGEMNPRLRLTAVPYAFQAKSATQLQTIQGSFNGTLDFNTLNANRTIHLPDENGTVCLQASASCGFVTGTASNYIQNQNSGAQVSSNFWISGTGTAATLQGATSVLTPLLDTATATALNIGTTNATVINLNENTNIAAGKTLTVNGASTFNLAYGDNMTVNSDISAGNRTTNAFTISQANNASFTSSQSLLAVKNLDTDTTAAVVDITQNASGGVGLQIGGPTSASGTGILIASSYTGGHPLTISNIGNMTSGTGIRLIGNGAAVGSAFTGQYLLVAPTRAYTGSGTITDTGEYLNVTRQLTNSGTGTFANTGNLVNLNSNCIVVSGACTDSGSILNLNQQSAAATGVVLNVQNAGSGNMVNLVNGGGTVLASFDASGNLKAPTINAVSGYQFNGTAGSTTTCTAGNVLQNANVQGGIVTSVTCAAASAGLTGSGTVGTIAMFSSTGTNLGDSILTQSGTIVSVAGTLNATTALQGPLLDTATATALNVGTTNATSINLNQNVIVAAQKTITMVGGLTSQRPASPTEGMLYFDTTTKQLLTYANGKWQADRSTANKIVAMGTATGCSGTVPVASANPDSADYVSTSCTSSQTVINNAINSLPAGGGTVYLMDGTYIIDGSITLNSNVTLAGSGPGTVIKLKNGTATNVDAIYAALKNRVTIRDLRIDGNKANNAGMVQVGIYLGSVGSGSGGGAVSGGSIRDVEVTNFTSRGLYSTNTVNAGVRDSLFIANNNDGIYADGGRLVLDGNRLQGNGGSGLQLAGVNDVAVSNNVFDGNAQNGVYAYALNSTFTGNTADGNTQNGLQLVIGTHNTVSSNTFVGNGASGIYIDSAGNNTITGNAVYNNASAGIYLYVGSSYNTINGNNIYQNAGGGVYAWNSNTYNQITNNTLTDNGGTGAASAITLGISSNNNVISNNYITDTAGTGYAIDISTFTAASTLSHNTYSGTGASAIHDIGTGTIWQNQVDSNGNVINRGTGGLAVGKLSATSTLNIQGGYVGTSLPTPAAPTVTTQGTAGTTSYTYAITALDGTGETLPSTGTVKTTGNATLDTTNFNRITWTQVGGAISYKIYRTASGGTPSSTGLIGTVASSAALQFDDKGIAATTAVPAANTTGGMSVAGALQGSTASFTGSVSSGGTINAVSGFSFNGTAGATTTCTAGNVLQNANVQGGIVTGVTCGAAVTGGVTTIGAIDGGTYSANGASISGSTLYLQAASDLHVGLVTTGGQIFAGNKTFNDNVTVASGKTITLVGGITSLRPAAPTEGTIYFDTTTKQLLTYANGKWQADRSTATEVVADGSTSQNPESADFVVPVAATNAESTINSAIAALPSSGGTVVLREGTYTVSGSVNLSSNVTLAGAGAGTVIKQASGSNLGVGLIQNSDAINGNDHITIRDLKLDGNKTNQTTGAAKGINLTMVGAGTTTVGVHILNVWAENFRDAGIQLNNSANSTVVNTSSQFNDNNGIGLSNTSYSSITGGVFSDNTSVNSAGITISGGATGNTISGNTVRNNGNHGITVANSNYNVVSGNNIYSNGVATTANGLNATGTSLGNTYSNNVIVSNSGNGITVGTGADNTITGNTIKLSGQYGIRVAGSVGSLFSGNTISDSGNVTTSDGSIVLLNSATNNTFIGNKLTETAGTGRAFDINAGSNNNVLNGNYIGTGANGVWNAGGPINDAATGTVYIAQTNNNNNVITSGPKTSGLFQSNDGTNNTDPTLVAKVQGSATADLFQAQNSSGNAIFKIGSTGTLTVGLASNTTGTIVLQNSTNANTVTVASGVTSSSYQLTLPTAAGTAGQCMAVSSVTTGNMQLGYAACGGAGGTGTANTIAMFTASSTIGNSILTQSGTTISVAGTLSATTALQAPLLDTSSATTLGIGTAAASAITIGQSGVTTTVAGPSIFGGSVLVKPTTSATNAFEVQGQTGGKTFIADSANQKVAIGAYTVGSTTGQLEVIPTTSGRVGIRITGGTGGAYAANYLEVGSSSGATDILRLQSSGNLQLGGSSLSSFSQSTASTDSTGLAFGTGAVSGTTSNSGDTSLKSGNSTTSGNTGAVVVASGAATSGNSGSVTIDSGTASGTAGTVNVGTSNASSLLMGRSGAAFTLQGNSASTLKATNGGFTTTLGFTAPTATRSIVFGDESGTVCLQGSANCGFVTGTAANYIQNQNSGAQVSSNFWISGTGTATTLQGTTSVLTPLLDTATATALNIGTTNATVINLNENTSIATGKTLTVNGSSTFNLAPTDGITVNSDLSTGSRSSEAITITQANNASNTSSAPLLTVKNFDTDSTSELINITQSASGGIGLRLGGPASASGTGILLAQSYTGGHALSISNLGNMTTGTGIRINGDGTSVSAAFSGQYIVVNPTRTYQGSGTVTDSGNALNIARSLTNSGTGTFANTGNLVDLSSNCIVVSGSCTDSGSILNLNQQSTNATGTVLNIQNAGSGKALAVNGASVFQSTDTAALVIQNSSSVAVLTVDTQNLQVIVGTTTNGVVLSANGIQLKGTARNSEAIVLTAEYAGAVLDNGTGSNNTGTMTSGVNTSNRMNYYKWTTTQATPAQTYDVVVQVPLPSDFDSWTGATPSITFNTYSTDLTNGKITLGLYDTSGGATSCVEGTTSITPGSTSTWSTSTPSCTGGTYTAGGYMTLRIRMSAMNNSVSEIGNITLNYLSKY